MRSTLSPAFTSSKIKLMVPFMEEVGKQMIRALEKKIKDSDSKLTNNQENNRYSNVAVTLINLSI